jgi:hypothetical protein
MWIAILKSSSLRYRGRHTVMSIRRGRSRLAPGALVASLLVLSTTACTSLVGGAAFLGLVAVGALTSRCYDYLDVTVLDADGRKTCAATVTATNGKSQLELTSCYYSPLTDGRWKLRARLAGFSDALSTVEVDHANDCTRHVQTVELTLHRPGAVPAPRRVVPAPAAVPLPPSATAPPAAVPIPPTLPEGPAAPSSTAPSSALPASSAPPSVGVFPDR